MKKWAGILLIAFLSTACAHGHSNSVSPVHTIKNDPNFAFTLPAAKCDGTALTTGTGVNIWAITGSGPMPMIAITGSQTGCNGNKIDTTKATKLNTALITVTTGTILSVPSAGPWYFCDEAADPAGNRSLIGDCQALNVSIDPGVPTNLKISGREFKIIVAMKPLGGFKVS